MFQCTNCYTELLHKTVNGKNSISGENGYLECPSCKVNTPVVNGIIYFTESDISYQEDPSSIYHSLANRIEDKRKVYEQFIHEKASRNLIDPYSAFQPFNESSRSFYPFIKVLRAILKPGDKILDTWCRTGWSGYFLSSLFPQQQIISVWEGDSDVLGYSGFDFWFGHDKPENLQVIFHDLNKPLPFVDDSFQAVHALDTLHRYNQANLIPELLRVVAEDGLIVCPHNHLTNSNPTPFFERGEKQLHGLDYDRYFKRLLSKSKRLAYIISEPGLFDLKSPKELYTEPDTSDYNALIVILPVDSSIVLEPYSFETEELSRLRIIVNPYFKFNYAQNKAFLEPAYLNGIVGEMLSRHPVYHKRCSSENDLTDTEIRLIYLAKLNYTCQAIAEMLQVPNGELMSILQSMLERELIQVLPLAIKAVDLQLYHSAIPLRPSADKQILRNIIGAGKFGDNPVIIDIPSESRIQTEDVNYLVSQLKNAMLQSGVDQNTKLIVCSYPQFEILITFWAAMDLGVETFVISSELPKKQKLEVIQGVQNGFLLFTDKASYEQLRDEISDTDLVIFDDPEIEYHPRSFADWIENYHEENPESLSFDINPNSSAVTLFSSGTTGKPKGIRLSHKALLLSGELLSRTFGWSADDKIVMASEIDAMSGLRNVCIASCLSGTTIVVPTIGSNRTLSIIESIEKSEATILTCTPALIKNFVMLGENIKQSVKSLKQVLCTAGNLPPGLVDEFKSLFNIRVLNYYGLTETSGLCIAETNPDEQYNGSIGEATDSVIQVVDERDNLLPVGEVGRLRVFSDRLFTGYLDEHDPSNLLVRDGWLYTGDLAYLDKNGRFYLKGRERDIIKDAAGNVIYLEEIENLLITHPRIKDLVLVQETIEDRESLLIVAAPTDPYGNVNDLKSQIKKMIGENLGESKIPSKIEFTSELIRNGRGNVNPDQILKFLSTHEGKEL